MVRNRERSNKQEKKKEKLRERFSRRDVLFFKKKGLKRSWRG